MKITRTFLGSGGVQKVSLDRLISEAFGCSQSEAIRLLSSDRVRLDGEVTHLRDAPVADLAGKRLSVDKEGVDLEA